MENNKTNTKYKKRINKVESLLKEDGRKPMKKLFHIDDIQLKQEKEHSVLCIIGWYVPQYSEEVTFHLSVNSTEQVIQYDCKRRPDVVKALGGKIKKLEVGFEIKSWDIIRENTGLIELNVTDGPGSISLLKLNRKEICELVEKEMFRYNIDNVEKKIDNGRTVYYVTGWAVLQDVTDHVIFTVRAVDGHVIESETSWVERPDLIAAGVATEEQKKSGFRIKYYSEAEDDCIEIKNEKKIVREIINIQKYIRRSRGEQRKQVARQMRKSLSIKNLFRLVRYVYKHGFKGIRSKIFQAMSEQDVAIHYQDWFDRHKATIANLQEQRQYKFKFEPKVSILVPTYNTPTIFLKEMLDSVLNQSYQNWQLCIGDGSEGNEELENILKEYCRKDSRIVFKVLEKNEGISGNTNGALELADGEFIGLLDHDDLLEPDALFEVVKELQNVNVDIVYTDEDKVMGNPLRNLDPNFKPDFSIDLFRSYNYITHFFCVRKSIVDEIGGFRSEYDGSQDYDLMFRCIEKAKEIRHVAKILYHWRMHASSTAENPESKMYCYEAGRHAIESHLRRSGVQGTVEHAGLWGMYHVIYDTPGNPLISIIIPNKDHIGELDTCIRSIIKKSVYRNFEFIIVENNSEEEHTFRYYDEIQKEFDNIKVVMWGGEFNYSAINNFGVSFASGEYILLLNNDTELIEKNSLSDMLGICMRKEVGIVGAKLLFEDDTVQHAGIVIGFGGFAGHVFSGIGKDDYGYMVRARINCNYSAVTAACLMTKKSVYEKVNGLSENFAVALNDVDFCLKVRAENYLVVYDAFSLWHHYESKSRGYEDTPEKQKRFQGEVKKFQDKWYQILEDGDPYYNKNFPVTIAPFTLD